MAAAPIQNPKQEFWGVLVLALGFGLVGIDRCLLSPMFPTIAHDLHLSYGGIGVITGALAIAWGFAALIMGNLSDRIGQRIVLTGSAATAVAVPIQVVRRASLDTGGTAATTTANPGVTTQIASRDTTVATNASASATLISYTAVPTINDSAPVYVDSTVLGLAATSVGVVSAPTVFDWSRDIENLLQVPTLAKGSTQQLCVNFGTTSITTGVLTGQITWTEE